MKFGSTGVLQRSILFASLTCGIGGAAAAAGNIFTAATGTAAATATATATNQFKCPPPPETSTESSSSSSSPAPVSWVIPTDNIIAASNSDAGGGIQMKIEVVGASESSESESSSESSENSGHLCTLTLQDFSRSTKDYPIPVPVARTYNGLNWETTAGPYKNSVPQPTCSMSVCTFTNLPPPPSENVSYVLTSYSIRDLTGDQKAARFLEQASFGPSRATIQELKDFGPNKYYKWTKDQIENIPKNSHREYFRKRINSRFEYPNQPASPGPESACHRLSHWRKFALDARDGLRANQTKNTKYLTIRKIGDRWGWFIEGWLRTTTSYRPKLWNGNLDEPLENLEVWPAMYAMSNREHETKSCIGCPLPVNKKSSNDTGVKGGYVKNPEIDLTGVIGNNDLIPYTIVDLPNILGNNKALRSIDNELFETSFYFSKYNAADDEFVLENNDSVNMAQCNNHPNPHTAGWKVKSRLNTSRNDEVDGKNHPETVFPSIFGKTFNEKTGKYEYLLFDPKIVLRDNTPENPIPDGGGFLEYDSNGRTYCSNSPRNFLNEHGCTLSYSKYACEKSIDIDNYEKFIRNPDEEAVVVCGCPGEVANDYTLGSVNGFGMNVSGAKRGLHPMIWFPITFTQQKKTIWANIALFEKDQLRQRMAWALYQLIPIGLPDTTGVGGIEVWLQYYDIFVNHAFGSFKNILKEIAYTDVMSRWLSHFNNMSLQYNIDNCNLKTSTIEACEQTHPDENFAREIMQLFSVGVFQLNMDGTTINDENGQPLHTYDSNDIMNMARAWTGLSRAYRNRGNAESSKWGPHVDAMHIVKKFRDTFPKSDINGGYIGDNYPLCADLPAKDHLKKGAVYRLNGSKSNPEEQDDDKKWEGNDNILRLTLEESSPLYAKLCAPEGGVCTFPGKVTLDANLLYNTDSLQGLDEFQVTTARTVRIVIERDGKEKFIHYEYRRLPCVEQAFLRSDAKRVVKGTIGGKYIYPMTVCADPRRKVATEMCCDPSWEEDIRKQLGYRFCVYHGERMTFANAIDRCEANGKKQCSPRRYAGSACNYGGYPYFSWTNLSCMTQAKISYETGFIARVDYPEPDYAGERITSKLVAEGTKNFFRVVWEGGEPSLPTSSSLCNAIATCRSVDDGCICDTSTTETAVFGSASDISSKEDIVSALDVGAFDPDMFDVGEITSLGNCNIDGVDFYSRSSDDSCASLSVDAFFGVDYKPGVHQYFKNMKSIVEIPGISNASFRNAPHFISFVDQDLRDMYYEVDAVIESLFYHPSHPPFVAKHFIQRFGISNPSPGYVERVATAYFNGDYDGIGSGVYGDLGALVAAVLLDDESRNVALDADPSHGHLREPVLKISSLIRSMDAIFDSPLGWNKYSNLGIGQSPYDSPSVFNFYLPEYQPPGVIEEAGLVAPEGELLTGKFVYTLIDGMYSTVKFGLQSCYNGFGDTVPVGGCPTEEGNNYRSSGYLSYSVPDGMSVDEAIDDIALLLTAGRLSSKNKEIIRGAIQGLYNNGDKAKATRIAQQLMLISPEFHSWGSTHDNTGVRRSIPGYRQFAKHSYKSVVYFYMEGGADSFNLIVPTGRCSKNLYAAYKKARGHLHMPVTQLLPIDATGSGQLCDNWGVHEMFPILKELYDQEEAMFFLNTGLLSKPLTKHDNWVRESKIRLFAHNHMEREQLALDIHQKNTGTGVGGRLLDMLNKNGYQTSGNTVDGKALLNEGDLYFGNAAATITTGGIKLIDEISSLPRTEMLELAKMINGEGSSANSLLGETWSERVAKTLSEYETSLRIDKALKSGEFNMPSYNAKETVDLQLKAVAQYMLSRDMRKVDREVFFVRQRGFDMHGTHAALPSKFAEANNALATFINELKRQGLWEDTVIMMGSDFGRSIAPNSNGGTDHAWGGNYFMLGGGLKGGKLMGEYPADLSPNGDQWVIRGRMIPTTPFESIWNGISEWMGVKGDADLDYVLPTREHFDKCSKMFTAYDLFKGTKNTPCIDDEDGDGVEDSKDKCPNTSYWIDAPVDSSGCQAPTTMSPTIYFPPTVSPTWSPTVSGDRFEAELADHDDSSNPTAGNSGFTGSGYINMGGKNSYVEWPEISGAGGPCILTFRYASTSKRSCALTINDQPHGTVEFVQVSESWTDWEAESIETTCPSGTFRVRITSILKDGGPNVDNLVISFGNAPSPTIAPVTPPPSPSAPVTPPPTSAPVTPSPTVDGIQTVTYEAEAKGNNVKDGSISNSNKGFTGTGYVNMGGMDSYVEFVGASGGSGGPCTLNFRYAVKESDSSSERDCLVTFNGNAVGTAKFIATGPSWGDYDQVSFDTTCPSGLFDIRVTASTRNGGPNLDHVRISKATGFTAAPTVKVIDTDPTLSPVVSYPTKDPTKPPTASPTSTPYPTKGPTSRPVAAPVENPDDSVPMNTIMDIDSTVEYIASANAGIETHIFDGSTNRFWVQHDFSETNPGFYVKPSNPTTIVRGIRLYTPNCCNKYDMTAYTIEGRNDGEETWHLIYHNEGFKLPQERNQGGKLIESTYESGDGRRPHYADYFVNTVSYSEYRVLFPGTENVMLGEVELPGFIVFGGSASPTMTPTKWAPPPGSTPVNTLIDANSIVKGVHTITGNNLQNLSDGTTEKSSIEHDGSDMDPGFEVKPTEPFTIVRGIRFYTPNCCNSNDPKSYSIEGRNDGEDTWHLIHTNNMKLPGDRNQRGKPIESTYESGDSRRHHYEEFFENTVSYREYRVLASTGKIVTAEVELPGLVLSDATSSPVASPTTEAPTKAATDAPTTVAPTKAATDAPTTAAPTKAATDAPTTVAPTKAATDAPTTAAPTKATSDVPSATPSLVSGSSNPSFAPSITPIICADSPLKVLAGNNKNKKMKACASFAKQRKKWCKKMDVKTHCPKTCKLCDKFASSDSTGTFEFGGERKDCDSVRGLFPKSMDELIVMCQSDDIRGTCRETCAAINTCQG